MSRVTVFTKDAPPPRAGVNCQAIIAGGLVFCSGTVPQDMSGNIVEGDIQAHTHQCIKNLTAVLAAAGSSIKDVAKVNIFLADMANFDKMNEVYMQYWGDEKPARTCVAVKTLPKGADIEIECVGVVTAKL